MKGIILFLLMILIGGSLTATPLLGVSTELEAGIADGQFGGYAIEGSNQKVVPTGERFETAYLKWTATIWAWERLYIAGDATIQMIQTGEIFRGTTLDQVAPNYDPQFTNYGIEVGIHHGPVELFYRHDCTHPQTTYQYAYRVTNLWGEGAVSRLGIRLEGSFGRTP